MKSTVLTFVLLVTSLFGFAQEEKGITINVVIDNVASDEGKVLVSLHTADTFMRGGGIQDLESTIENGKVEFTFEDVPAGTYAIMALHDVNENYRMDYEADGRPKESYGMSGNEMIMGPPNFADAKFEVENENLELAIRF
ncbi:DUF2141 domain-containing protein [Flagellimonas allohymeniacidonis]|uniref:DUF2141 domain-containing protein n=1 Tax=Flagellimonas allohymeniacidonis TaxID=2517819 RepID=A0A4Q8QIX8_9FLAO|nr:DUF2141 domain-containing protein [Allomuricauda hymeniacidonis]TAI49238.1 DUF2141 domain-containing protein [Allomuricauda hymeniacidonis]